MMATKAIGATSSRVVGTADAADEDVCPLRRQQSSGESRPAHAPCVRAQHAIAFMDARKPSKPLPASTTASSNTIHIRRDVIRSRSNAAIVHHRRRAVMIPTGLIQASDGIHDGNL